MSKSKGVWLSEWLSDKVTYWAVCGQLKIDPHDNNVEREVTESNENRKQKIDNNVYNQPNLEINQTELRKSLVWY